MLVDAKKILTETHGIPTRIVSVPSFDLFDKQSKEYKDSVFIPGTKVLFVEASSCLGAEKFADCVIGMTTFGASAPAKVLKQHFGFTVDNVVARSRALIGE